MEVRAWQTTDTESPTADGKAAASQNRKVLGTARTQTEPVAATCVKMRRKREIGTGVGWRPATLAL